MITLVLHLLRLLPLLVGGHRQLALENLALRQQLAVYKRTMPRQKLHTTDRLFWAGLARVWTGWRQALVIVSPDTVLPWQRRRFREYWARLSRRPAGGRPPLHAEIADLVRKMAAANALWGAPRIHGRAEGRPGTSSGPSPAPRHIERRERISRTPLSCRLHANGYATYPLGVLSGAAP